METKENPDNKDTQNRLITLITRIAIGIFIIVLVLIYVIGYMFSHPPHVAVPVEQLNIPVSEPSESPLKALLDCVAHGIVFGAGRFLHVLKISSVARGMHHLLNVKELMEHAKYGMILGLFSEFFTHLVTLLWNFIF